MRSAARAAMVAAAVLAGSSTAGCAAALPGTPVAAQDAVGGQVVSARTADTIGPVDGSTLQGRLVAGPRDVPEGFRRTSVVVDRGIGSFSIGLPESYGATWWPGEPTESFLAQVQQRDPAWGAQARRIVARDPRGSSVRALALDTGNAGAVRMVVVTVGANPRGGRDGLIADTRAGLRAADARAIDVHPVVANGVDGVYVEYRQPSGPGHVPDRASISVRISDPHNDVQWGVTCDVPDGQRDTVREQCLRIAGSFRPLPAVAG